MSLRYRPLVILGSPTTAFPRAACACFDWVATVLWINNSTKGITIAICRWESAIKRAIEQN